jgi:type I restriction enzyme S subunit
VDELMALCDRLEARQQDAEAAHRQLVQVLLHRLTQARDAAEFQASWERVAAQFEVLFTTEESIDGLVEGIRSLATAGVFASTATMQNWKRWPLQKLEEISEAIVDCPHSTPKWTESGEICVRTSQFRPGFLDLNSLRFVSGDTYVERTARLVPQAGDILYSREGGILGVACRVPDGVRLCLGQRMMLFRTGTQVSAAFLELVLNSPQITRLAKEHTTGGAAPRINVSTIRAFPIPVPTLEEQRDTLQMVDKLMALCNRLRAGITNARAKHTELADSIVTKAVRQ